MKIIDDFWKWIKGTELVELDDIDVSQDPVRPELTLGFRITHDRKILGLTPMATHFHIKNGAKQVHINDVTQNFEYDLNKKV